MPGSYISPNFAEYALQSRMKRNTWKSARYVAQAVARLKKKNLGKKDAAHAHDHRVCALYEYVIRRILCIILVCEINQHYILLLFSRLTTIIIITFTFVNVFHERVREYKFFAISLAFENKTRDRSRSSLHRVLSSS